MQSESTSSADGPVCNLAAALERLDGDRDLLLMLIGVYLEDSEALVERLVAAIEERDAAEAQRASHSLKGLAANFDGTPAAQAALVIEAASRQGDWLVVTAGLPPLEQEVSRLRQALADFQRQ